MSKAALSLLMMSSMFASECDFLFDDEFDARFDDWMNKNNKEEIADYEAYEKMHTIDGAFSQKEFKL